MDTHSNVSQLLSVTLLRKRSGKKEHLSLSQCMMKDMRLLSLPQLKSGKPSRGDMSNNICRGRSARNTGVVSVYMRACCNQDRRQFPEH